MCPIARTWGPPETLIEHLSLAGWFYALVWTLVEVGSHVLSDTRLLCLQKSKEKRKVGTSFFGSVCFGILKESKVVLFLLGCALSVHPVPVSGPWAVANPTEGTIPEFISEKSVFVKF